MSSSDSSVKVAVRVRPLNQREKASSSNVIVHMEGRQTTLEAAKYSSVETRPTGIPEKSKNKPKRFVYDYSYWSTERSDSHYVSQEQVFKDLGTLVLGSAFEGYNACVFAYGQTGAGKTYTMMGEKNDPGLIPRICKGLYGHVSNSNQQESFRIEVSYLEIYNEQVWDLLRPVRPEKKEVPASRLKVREHPREGPYVQGLTRNDAPDNETLETFLNQGNFLRTTAATNMNDQSSRSHAIFTITFTQAKFVAGLPSEVTSKIHLVDLAGSERVAKSGATGDRLKEGGNINRSLTTLGLVISALAERSSDSTQKKLFIPYRDSVLTWLLKDSLGGNSKTIMIAAISPSDTSYGETLSTLRYADRAKNIVNAPTVNEDPNVKLIRELKTEIGRLKAIIAGNNVEIPASLTTLENVDQAQKLLEGTEHKMAKHLRVWAEKWRSTLNIIEESDLGLRKHGSALRIDVDPPHLVLLDNDPLNTSITIFSLKPSRYDWLNKVDFTFPTFESTGVTTFVGRFNSVPFGYVLEQMNKEGDNLIGNLNAAQNVDLVFDGEEIKKEHCVVTYDLTKVFLTPKDGSCCVNSTVVNEPIKLSQGDIIVLSDSIRLKFNFPLEANALREKRKSLHITGSTENVWRLASSPINFLEKRPDNPSLSPVTDESGVEIDFFELNDEGSTEKTIVQPTDVQIEVKSDLNNESEYDKKSIDDLRRQVEELFAKYKESEILRFEAESRNQIILEEENEIQEQTRKLLELQKDDEALLQQYKNDLETLHKQLSEKKNDVRAKLDEEMGNLFDNVISENNEITDCSKKELEKYREGLKEQLQREWSVLDQYEMKLIEIEAEKRKILNEAEVRLKKEREVSDKERKTRLKGIEADKSRMQGVLEEEIKKREFYRNDYKQKERETNKCRKKSERGIQTLVSRTGELEWAEYKLSRDEGNMDEDEVSTLGQTVKDLTEEVEGLQRNNEKKMAKLSTLQDELSEKARIFETSKENVQNCMAEFEEIRQKLADCQQQFGEELGDIVNTVYQERDAELEKIECEKEMLMHQHLEHQIALEVLVNDGFERIAEGNEASHEEARAHVAQLIRSASPGVEPNSLKSEIIEKRVQIHQQQMDYEDKEEERRILYDKKEQEFLALRQGVQNERENEQNELIAKIRSLERLLKIHGAEAEESADYFESESSNLMNAQHHILNLDKQLRDKLRKRREIEHQLDSLKLQIELQAESSQEQFREDLEDLKERAKENDNEIDEMKKRFGSEADQYLMRLRRESFVILEKNVVESCYAHVANNAVDEILKEIAYASHVPELAETYHSVTQDCNGWSYETREKDVDLLMKEGKNHLHCFLGRGIIRASPHSILQAVSNPLSRFVYDRMLKNIRIVENIADELKIVYMLHETTHCFIKQSRDFCFVAFQEEKDGKLILACQSVEHPNCPEIKGIVRAKILSSGWVIEPITINGLSCSLVWYLTRVYLGNPLPSKLVSLVSKRQPLSVAYLREYLTSEN